MFSSLSCSNLQYYLLSWIYFWVGDPQGGLIGLSILSYSELWFIIVGGCKAKSAKGKGSWGQVQRTLGSSFQESFPSGVTQDVQIPMATSCKNMCERLSTREAHWRLRPQGFTGSWSCRHPLPSTYQNSRLPEGNQVFSINHSVCTNSWGTAILSYTFCKC